VICIFIKRAYSYRIFVLNLKGDNMRELDSTDSAILNRIQSDFPITSRPFLTVADELELTEDEVLERVARLKADGIIRRIGGNLVPGKLGFVSTLCAASVPADKIDRFAEIVNRYPGVTHNYQRDNTYNVWFTFIAPSMEEIEDNLRKIVEDTGVEDILNLPATKVFKIRAEFEV
jgi:DNA-binding Lrp family transcriptional regulator